MIRKIRNRIARGAAFAGFAALALLAAPAAHAVDGVALELGRGNDDTNLWRGALQWNGRDDWLRPTSSLRLRSYWDLSYGQWRAPDNLTIKDLGLTPVFRLQGANSVSPYLEAAIGFHLVSNNEVTPDRQLGIHFQFGSHLGAGLRFGPGGKYDLSLRLQHLSNAGIASPNNGINFGILRLQYHLH